jgi:hypothetical protein
MLATELRGKVGVAPGTTTIYLGQPGQTVEIPEITEGQYRYETIHVQQKDLEMRRKGALWSKLGAIGTGGLAALALIGAIAAWMRTGRIQVVK